MLENSPEWTEAAKMLDADEFLNLYASEMSDYAIETNSGCEE